LAAHVFTLIKNGATATKTMSFVYNAFPRGTDRSRSDDNHGHQQETALARAQMVKSAAVRERAKA
jgi:ABC-type branched-subunit amino acid transport system ATPase component